MTTFVALQNRKFLIAIFILVTALALITLSSLYRTSLGTWKGNGTFIGSKCIDVNGTVLGNPEDGAAVNLYRVKAFDYKAIVAVIDKSSPEQRVSVHNRSFSFRCLPSGHYLLTIPATSFNYSVGSPIVEKNKRDDLEARTILQGGNSQCLFSVISIEHVHRCLFTYTARQRE